MLTYNLQQIVKEPTKITHSSSTCIDLVLMNVKSNNRQSIVNEFGFSDHKGLLFSIQGGKKDT